MNIKNRTISRILLIAIFSIAILAIATPLVAAGNNTTYIGSSFYPDPVKFRIKTIIGLPISNVTVNATTVATTSDTDFMDAILNFFGIGSGGEDIQMALDTMEGITGTDGSVVFFMFRSYLYQINFTHIYYEIDPIRIYPNDKEYLILVYPTEGPNLAKDVYFNLTIAETNATAYNLGLYYNDTTLTTTNVWFFVKADRYDENGSIITETLHSENFGASLVSTSHIIFDTPGENATLPYYWGFSATTGAFEDPINQTKLVRFDHKLVEFGADIDDIWYVWSCIVILVLIAGLGSFYNIKETLMTLVLFAGLFKFIGWYSFTGSDYFDWSVISFALTIAFLYYIRHREKEEHL